MMWTDERKNLARVTCLTWRGTRHKNRICRLQIGIDCIRFVAEVLRTSEVISGFSFPYYATGHGIFVTHNFMEDIFAHLLYTEEIDVPEFGALIVCRVGKATNHCGIVIDEKAWHVPFASEVKPDRLDLMDIQTMLRITQPGFRNDPSTLRIKDFVNG